MNDACSSVWNLLLSSDVNFFWHAWLSLLPLTTVGFWRHDDDSKSHAHMVQRLNGPWLNGCSVSGTAERLNFLISCLRGDCAVLAGVLSLCWYLDMAKMSRMSRARAMLSRLFGCCFCRFA